MAQTLAMCTCRQWGTVTCDRVKIMAKVAYKLQDGVLLVAVGKLIK